MNNAEEMTQKLLTEAAIMEFCTQALIDGAEPAQAKALAEKLLAIINSEATDKLNNGTIAIAVAHLMDAIAMTGPQGSHRHTIAALANIALNHMGIAKENLNA